MSETVQFFPGEDGQFYFRIVASNGETVAVSEGYTSLSNARRGHAALKRAMGGPASTGAENEPD